MILRCIILSGMNHSGFANVSALTLHAVLLVLVVTGTVVEIVTLLLSLEPVATLITDSYFISTHLTSTR